MIKGKKLYLLDAEFSPEELLDEGLKQVKKVYLEKTKLTELHVHQIELFPKISQITVLHLNDNKLMNLPSELEQFTKLKRLYLQKNVFQRIPLVLFKLASLEELHLQENQIEELPGDIKKLTNLRTLDISHNCLKFLPLELAELKLKKLDVSNNVECVFPPQNVIKSGSKAIFAFITEEKERVSAIISSASHQKRRSLHPAIKITESSPPPVLLKPVIEEPLKESNSYESDSSREAFTEEDPDLCAINLIDSSEEVEPRFRRARSDLTKKEFSNTQSLRRPITVSVTNSKAEAKYKTYVPTRTKEYTMPISYNADLNLSTNNLSTATSPKTSRTPSPRTPSPRTPQSLRSPSGSVSTTSDVRDIFPTLNNRLSTKYRRNSIHLAELVERELKSTPKQISQLTGLLAEKKGYRVFEAFLEKEFAAENLHFWKEVENFHGCKEAVLKEEGKKIYEEYLKDNAPHELNVTAAVKQKITSIFEDENGLELLRRESFDLAQRCILDMIQYDSFRRFCDTDAFKQLQEEAKLNETVSLEDFLRELNRAKSQ